MKAAGFDLKSKSDADENSLRRVVRSIHVHPGYDKKYMVFTILMKILFFKWNGLKFTFNFPAMISLTI